jgi:CHAD domain-containing protein
MQEQLERETKWAVGEDFVVPPLDDVVPGAQVEVAAVELESIYYDTADYDLRAHGIVVRNRRGDDDTGWQVKLPVDDGDLELHWPPAESMSEELSRVLAGVSLGKPLQDITTIRTRRRRHRVSRDGVLQLELADDGVRASSGSVLLAWREIEVELGNGTTSVPKTLRKRLKASGARHPRFSSKLAQATGGDGQRPTLDKAPAAFVAYLDAQIGQIIRGDLELRRGLDPIHDTRVAIRRTRSIMRVFAKHLDPAVGAFEAELKWFAGVLGEVRDAQVQQQRFADALDGIAPELILGPVRARVGSHLQGIELPARKAVDDAMVTERYLHILKTLRQWRAEPPIAADISVDALRDDARRATRKARRRLGRSLDRGDTELLHGARKAAKRARYAAELVSPVDGSAEQRSEEHKQVQSVLGDHQDAVVAMDVLRRLGASAGTSAGENGFTLGILYAREENVAAQCRTEARTLA